MIPVGDGRCPHTCGKPRASGDDPPAAMASPPAHHVNPARAGMIPAGLTLGYGPAGKPRASGDDPADDAVALTGPE